jgi:hypothetical protein
VVGAYQFKNAPSYEDAKSNLNASGFPALLEAGNMSNAFFDSGLGLDLRSVIDGGFYIPNGFGPTGGYYTSNVGFGAIVKYKDLDVNRDTSVNHSFLWWGKLADYTRMVLARKPYGFKRTYSNGGGADPRAGGPDAEGIMAMSGANGYWNGVVEAIPGESTLEKVDQDFYMLYMQVTGTGRVRMTPACIIEAFAFYRNDALGQNIQAITDAMAQI